jgi:anti-anti-sigma factor
MKTVVMVFAGEYDLTHREQLHAEFDALRNERKVILDMTTVTYLDSTCIGLLARLHTDRLANSCEQLSIVNGTPIVKRLFHLLGFESMFHIVGTLDEALPKDGVAADVRYAIPGDLTPSPLPQVASRAEIIHSSFSRV